jgi:carbon monoxide dehydrogenase subunit G
MSVFESTVVINKPSAEVYSFLADMNNHRLLMPDDISEWTSTKDVASFNIRNMIKLSLKMEEHVPNSIIRIMPAEKPPFEVELVWTLTDNGGTTQVDFSITAGLNMMMKMVASGPLQKLADDETMNLAKQLN